MLLHTHGHGLHARTIVAVPVDVSADWFAGSADLRADWLKLYDEFLKGYDEGCSYVFLHQRANVVNMLRCLSRVEWEVWRLSLKIMYCTLIRPGFLRICIRIHTKKD